MGSRAAKRKLADWPNPPELFQLHFFGGCAGCFSTYCLMNSIKTSVIFLPSAAVAALKASCRLASTFRFMRFHRGSCRRFTLLRAHKIAFFIRVYSRLTLICAYQHSSVANVFVFLRASVSLWQVFAWWPPLLLGSRVLLGPRLLLRNSRLFKF